MSKPPIKRLGKQIENLTNLAKKVEAGDDPQGIRALEIARQTRAARITLWNIKEELRMRKLVIDDELRSRQENVLLGLSGYRYKEY